VKALLAQAFDMDRASSAWDKQRTSANRSVEFTRLERRVESTFPSRPGSSISTQVRRRYFRRGSIGGMIVMWF
jgi:hypothetical protein